MAHDLDPEDPRCAHVILAGDVLKVDNNSTEEKFAKEVRISLFSVGFKFPSLTFSFLPIVLHDSMIFSPLTLFFILNFKCLGIVYPSPSHDWLASGPWLVFCKVEHYQRHPVGFLRWCHWCPAPGVFWCCPIASRIGVDWWNKAFKCYGRNIKLVTFHYFHKSSYCWFFWL